MIQIWNFAEKRKVKQFEIKQKVTGAVKMFILYFNRYDVINYGSLAALKIEFCFLLILIHFFQTRIFRENASYKPIYI